MRKQKTKYDNRKQRNRIKKELFNDEQLIAVYDCKGTRTGFLGLTDRRLIYYDQGLLFGKNVVNIPLIDIITAQLKNHFISQTLIVTTAHKELVFKFVGSKRGKHISDYIAQFKTSPIAA